MKIVTVVGARPQFIKAAALSRILRKNHKEVLVHTGQHHDRNMSAVFFEELDIPHPDYHLGISGGSHGQMTGRMLIALEEVLLREAPDLLLVYGDTNSTLAGALAAVKLRIPMAHVEAGNRFGSLASPEEVNRIITDRISTFLFACVESSVSFLAAEGRTDHVYFTGDPMYDAFLYYKGRKQTGDFFLTKTDGSEIHVPSDFYYMTCHRQENTDTEQPLCQILAAMDSLDAPTVYPVHPRNRAMAESLLQKHTFSNIILCEPVGYLQSNALVCGASSIVTDSGGIQREAFFAGVPCLTILDFEAWPETLHNGMNRLAKADKDDILGKLSQKPSLDPDYHPFGDGHACEKIVDILTANEGEIIT